MNGKLWRNLVLAAFVTVAGAAENDDGPGRGVARVSVINGDVSVRRGDSGDWVAAAVNAPLIAPDQVITGANSRAEVQLDYANMVRLGANSELRLSELEHQRYLLGVARGTVTFRVLRDSQAEVDLDAPAASVRPLKKGVYRLTVHEDGATEVTVRSGEAEVYTPQGVERLRGGKSLLVRSAGANTELAFRNAPPEDEWDRWNERRDRDLERSQSYRYVSRDIYGAEDLDHHGSWVYVPAYGWVWAPRVAPGWAPYRYGRWSWVDWYGWTWVSYDPWGWAPYHYGRWFHHAPFGWCWYPGSIHVRHYYRPALVAFIGWNSYSGFNVGIGVGGGFGRVGWVPLAPYEPYYPWYGGRYYSGYRNRTYVDNRVTIVNNVNVRNVYRNARITNAITVVDGNDFGRGRGTRPARLTDNEMRSASLVRGQLPMSPHRDSLRLSEGSGETVRVPERRGPERLMGRREANPVERVPFQEQQQAMEDISRRTFEREPARRVQPGGGEVPTGGAGNEMPRRRVAGGGEEGNRGWRTTDENRDNPQGVRNTREGWRRLGEPAATGEPGATVTPRSAERIRGSEGPRGTERIRGVETPRSGEEQPNRGPERVEQPRNNPEPGGWRRFGEPIRGTGRAAEPRNEPEVVSPAPAEGNPEARENWRRFGGASTGERPTNQERRTIQDRTPEPRFERRNEGQEGTGNRGYPGPQRREAPAEGEPRWTPPERRAPSAEQQERSEPIRISPPIIRERSEPRVQRAPEGGRVFGGERRAAPAPRMERGGESGGGMRREGGGGGRRGPSPPE